MMMMILEHSMGKDDGQSHINKTHTRMPLNITFHIKTHIHVHISKQPLVTLTDSRRKEFIEL